MEALDALMAKVVEGHRTAFRSLYDATSTKLFAVIQTVVFDRREAEEVLQEVYVKVWLKASTFDPVRGRPISWLITIARNRALDQLRWRPAQSTIDIDRMQDICDPPPPAAVLTFAARDARRLPAALAKLPPRTSAAIQSTYFEGLQFEEVAARDSIPVGLIKSWVRRKLQQMRAEMTVEMSAISG